MSNFFLSKKKEEEMTIHFLQPTVLELGSCVGRCMVAPAAEFKEVVVLCARTLKRTILLQPHRTQRVSGHFCSKTLLEIISGLISVFIPIVNLEAFSKIAAQNHGLYKTTLH